jgi:hypothetical protein
MSGKKRYYPNNWQEYKDSDDDMFDTHTFEELMTWKVGGWELPSSVACIIRVADVNTGKVKEHVYQRTTAARKKVAELIKTPGIEFTVCDHDAIHHLTQEEIDDDCDDF